MRFKKTLLAAGALIAASVIGDLYMHSPDNLAQAYYIKLNQEFDTCVTQHANTQWPAGISLSSYCTARARDAASAEREALEQAQR